MPIEHLAEVLSLLNCTERELIEFIQTLENVDLLYELVCKLPDNTPAEKLQILTFPAFQEYENPPKSVLELLNTTNPHSLTYILAIATYKFWEQNTENK